MAAHSLLKPRVRLRSQDYSCVVVADAKGIRIFSLDTRQVCYQIGVGAVSAAEMLFSTSLLAFVGSGAEPICRQQTPSRPAESACQ